MPKTKSAERRLRSNERKHLHNRSVISHLRRVEKQYLALLAAGAKDKEETAKAFRSVCSGFDKAAKTGVIPKATANRKKSRLAARLNSVK